MKRNILIIVFSIFGLISFSQSPVNLSVTNINPNNVDLNWDVGTCTINYTMRYKENAANTWVPGTQIPNTGGSETYNLSGLNPATTYNWKVKCGGSWINGPDFTTSSSACNIIASTSVTNASCNNTLDGSVQLSVSGGASPYSFSWSNGSTNQNLIDVASGTYTVIITDNLGCTQNDTVIVGAVGNISINQTITPFNTNPVTTQGIVTAYHQWAYDTLSITNNGCDVRIRPEFKVSCSSGNIQQGDFVLKWQSPLGNTNIPYTIDANGDAIGYWSAIVNDSTGTQINVGTSQNIVIQVKFVNPALYGMYTAFWQTYEVDNSGNVISQSSAGAKGFRGSRKSTAFAAQKAGESAAETAVELGMKTVDVYVKGPGAGREAAIRAIQHAGIRVVSIKDVTPIPHNGCRPPKKRRV